MISDFARQQCLGYVANAMEKAKSFPKAKALFDWCNESGDEFGIDTEDVGPLRSSKWRPAWTDLERAVRKARRKVADAQPTRWASNVDALAGFFAFDGLETRIFAFAVHCALDSSVRRLVLSLDDGSSVGTTTVIATLLGAEPDAVASRLAANGRLVESGLIKLGYLSHYRDDDCGHFHAPTPLAQRLAGTEVGSIETLLAAIIGFPATTGLEWDDFAHLGDHRQFAADLLRGALASREPGINILIYGPPGTGKTEFCKVLAAHLRTELFQVGETDENGQEPERGERIDQLRLAQQVLSRRDNAVLLFDEMEDLLGSVHSRVSKIFTNRLLEQARVPTLWTCNDLESFDPALLRRMTLAIEMRTPSPQPANEPSRPGQRPDGRVPAELPPRNPAFQSRTARTDGVSPFFGPCDGRARPCPQTSRLRWTAAPCCRNPSR